MTWAGSLHSLSLERSLGACTRAAFVVVSQKEDGDKLWHGKDIRQWLGPDW